MTPPPPPPKKSRKNVYQGKKQINFRRSKNGKIRDQLTFTLGETRSRDIRLNILSACNDDRPWVLKD